MKKNRILLSDIFKIDEVDNNMGIFSYLAQLSGTPPEPVFPITYDFINQDNYIILDYDYEVGFSAEKVISPLFEKLFIGALESEGFAIEDFYNGLTYAELTQVIGRLFTDYPLIEIIYNRFGEKWKRVYDAMMSTYNPINNYDMEETRTPNLSTGVTANAESKTGVFGFNGTSAKDSATNDGNSSSTTTLTGTDTLTRKGNIGVTSTQQLITQELELRKHDFYRMIYMDIDSILCLKIY